MRLHSLIRTTLLIVLTATAVSRAQSADDLRPADHWPCFRGPSGQGYTSEENLPVAWGGAENVNVVWRMPLRGQGHASPIVWGDRLFVCTAAWPPQVLKREEVIPEHHVLCYHAGSGKLLWDTLVRPGPWLRNDFRSGPGGGYACPTPVTDGRLVYCLFGSSVAAALDFQGRIVWRKEIIPYTWDTAVGTSPVLYGDTLLLVCAMMEAEDSHAIALEKNSGAVRWDKPLVETGFGHSTPLLIRVGGQAQMLFLSSAYNGVASNALQSLDPQTGERLWWCRGSGDASSPVFGAGLVYFDSGRGGPGVAVDATGSGDVSHTHVKWTVENLPKDMSSPILVDGRLYRLARHGVLRCYELSSGRLVYTNRLDGLSSTWASPIADPHGRIYFATAGKSFVIQAGPTFQILGANDLHDANHASPAVAGGRMFLVGQQAVYCVGKP